MDKLDVAIIGAGPSGIYSARKLSGLGKKVAIFEKSRGIGGRLASKKMHGHIFNFGVNSFHSTAEELNEMVEHGVENETLIRDGVEITAKEAITDWTKGLVKGLDVRLEKEADRIEAGENENIIHFKDGDAIAAKDVIITTPAPQAAYILKNSGLEVPELNKVKYASAIYYMVSMDRELGEDLAEFKVLQHVKKDKDFYLLSFNEDWSEKPREELREEFDEVFRPVESHVHKWKFAKVEKQISSDCQMALKDKSIYLTGDYFYGDNMDSAVLSAQGVMDEVYGVD